MPSSRAADTSSAASSSWGWRMATRWGYLAGKTYLHARVRSARDQALADQLDLESSADNVINLFQPQLALDEAWPGFTFEKIDAERASLILGMFINGSATGARSHPQQARWTDPTRSDRAPKDAR
jgi:hypothetical protein